jgi:hypothetical protein
MNDYFYYTGTVPVPGTWYHIDNRPVFEANCQKSSPLSIILLALASFRTAAYHEITAPLWPLPRHHVLQTDVNPTACKNLAWKRTISLSPLTIFARVVPSGSERHRKQSFARDVKTKTQLCVRSTHVHSTWRVDVGTRQEAPVDG